MVVSFSFYSLRVDLGVEVLGATALLLRPGCGVGGAALGVLLGPLGLASGSALLLLRLHLGLGLGLLLVRPQDHDHVAAVLLGRRLDEAQLGHVLGQPLQQPEPELGA